MKQISDKDAEVILGLELRWANIQKKHGERWDALDDIENEIAKITGETDKAVSQRLGLKFFNWEKGKTVCLPKNVT